MTRIQIFSNNRSTSLVNSSIRFIVWIPILDCCHSGEFTKLVGRGKEAQQAVQQLRGDNGRGIIASSKAYQPSREDPNKNYSVFTSKIIEGIESGEADNSPADGKISVYELAKYVKDNMKGEKQTPIKAITGKGEIYIANNPKYISSPEKEAEILTNAKDLVKTVSPVESQLFGILSESSYDDPIGARDEVCGGEPVWNPKDPNEDGFFAAITSGGMDMQEVYNINQDNKKSPLEFPAQYHSFDRNVRILRFDSNGELVWRKTMSGGAEYSWAKIIPLENQEAILIAQRSDNKFLRFQKYDRNGNEVGAYWDYYPKNRGSESLYLSGVANSNGFWAIGEKVLHNIKINKNKKEKNKMMGRVKHQMFFLKYSNTGILELDKTWSPGYDIHPSNCVSNGLGGIYLTGYCKNEVRKSAFIAQINSDGEIEEFHNFDSPKWDERNDQIGVVIKYDTKFIYLLVIQTAQYELMTNKVQPNLLHLSLWVFYQKPPLEELTYCPFLIEREFNLFEEDRFEIQDIFEGHLGHLQPCIDVEPLTYPATAVLVLSEKKYRNKYRGDVRLTYIDRYPIPRVKESFIYNNEGNRDGHRRIIRTWFGNILTTGVTAVTYSDHPVIRNVKWKCNFEVSPFRPTNLDNINR